MQIAKNFMDEFFRARIAEELRHQESRAPFRRRFFSDECSWDKRSKVLEEFRSEEIVDIVESDLEATVISTYAKPGYPSDSRTFRYRYHLQKDSHAWLIAKVEIQCLACDGQGDESCPCCKGKHWT